MNRKNKLCEKHTFLLIKKTEVMRHLYECVISRSKSQTQKRYLKDLTNSIFMIVLLPSVAIFDGYAYASLF